MIQYRPRSFSSNMKGGAGTSKTDIDPKQQRSAIIVTTTANSKQLMNQPPQQQLQPANRYKTELCRPFLEYNHCRYGDKCQFAHGKSDLRTPQRHPRYKTELCRTYHSQGYCPYGARCHFIHSTIEARPMVSNGRGPSANVRISPQSSISYSKPPLSPSQDSGISSPPDAGTPNSPKVFEYPLSTDTSSLCDDIDPDWNPLVSDLQFSCDVNWDTSSTDGLSPLKTPPNPPFYDSAASVDDLTDHFSSTSLDECMSSIKPSRLPVFNQLNSYSDTALLSSHHDDWW